MSIIILLVLLSTSFVVSSAQSSSNVQVIPDTSFVSEYEEPDTTWTIYFSGRATQTIPNPDYPAFSVKIRYRGSGSAQFKAPEGAEGPIKAKGPLADAATVTPPGSTLSASGILSAKGRIRNDILRFQPDMDWPGVSAAYKAQWLLLPVTMDYEDSAVRTQRLLRISSAGPSRITSQATWRLRGKKKETWQVIITNRDKHSFGITSRVGAGVYVDWAVNVIVEIENERWKSGIAKVQILAVEPVSDPAGAFNVSWRTWTGGPYSINGRKYGREIWLPLWREFYSYYAVRYIISTNSRTESLLRQNDRWWGAENARNMRERGPLDILEIPMVPTTGLHILPLANRVLPGAGGDIITIRRLR